LIDEFRERGSDLLEVSRPIGAILSVRGSEARIGLPVPALSEAARATVGAFMRIWAGERRLIGLVTEVESTDASVGGFGAVAKVDLMGEITTDARGADHFSRGVSAYPAIGDPAGILGREELRLIYAGAADGGIAIGSLHHDDTIPARVSLDQMLSRHFAVLGSTGVGKSSGVAVILSEILQARPNLRIFLLDGHNEFGRCFGARAHVVNASNLKLPFWLFNFVELVDVLYGGHPGVDEETDILAEHIPVAKGMYLMHRVAQDRGSVRRVDPRRAGYTVDTPVPYILQDLVNLIDERMGKLENRATRMHYHRLLARIEAVRSDARYAFMFENANVGGDTMAEIMANLFRLEPNGQPMTVMQVAGLPAEVVDAVVCVVCRLAFDFGMWSDGAIPLLFVCEEAHRFAPADKSAGFAPTRRALMRIAKEGRKYGVYLGMVTQRPAELDPTIISQCNTIFAMRMSNDRDQALLRSAVPDAVANLLAFVPSLGTREVVAFGEGVAVPARLTFKELPADRIPRSETFRRSEIDSETGGERAFVRMVIERWRAAAGGSKPLPEEPSPLAAPSIYESPPPGIAPIPEADFGSRSQSSSVAARIDQIRAQILKRGGAASSS
jgi:DNA helicase HerA-like ATPase